MDVVGREPLEMGRETDMLLSRNIDRITGMADKVLKKESGRPERHNFPKNEKRIITYTAIFCHMYKH